MYKSLKFITSLILLFNLTLYASNDNKSEISTNEKTSKIIIVRNQKEKPFLAMPLTINNYSIGSTVAMSYFTVSVKPGVYILNSYSESKSTLKLVVDKNTTYYVRQKIDDGFFGADAELEFLKKIELKNLKKINSIY